MDKSILFWGCRKGLHFFFRSYQVKGKGDSTPCFKRGLGFIGFRVQGLGLCFRVLGILQDFHDQPLEGRRELLSLSIHAPCDPYSKPSWSH